MGSVAAREAKQDAVITAARLVVVSWEGGRDLAPCLQVLRHRLEDLDCEAQGDAAQEG